MSPLLQDSVLPQISPLLCFSHYFQTPWIKKIKNISSMQEAFSTSKRYTDENICRLHISIRFWSPGHPNQKVGRSTGDFSVGGFQHPSSLFSTLSSVIYSSSLTCSPLLLLLLPLLFITSFLFITFNPIYSYLRSEDSLLGVFTLN